MTLNPIQFWANARRMISLAALALMVLAFISPQTALAQPAAGWQRCASQDEICRFDGQAIVRYGVDGRYAYKVGTHRLICDQYEFGDPAFGQVKQCEFNPDLRAWPAGGGGLVEDAWLPCGGEGETCRLSGPARVRYGVDQRYVYRNATGSIRCSVDVFGDPAFGTPKRCEYQLLNAGGTAIGDAGWDFCATEGGVCRFSGVAEVRYGAKGRFVNKRAVNGVPCSVDGFGRDPIFGEKKSCFVRQPK